MFVLKRRRKAISGQTRRHLGQVFHGLARQKECQILEGHLRPNHVHICIAIPPKHPVASVIGFLKGKSAIAIARLCGKERNLSGEQFWARGYAVSTVGFELEQVRQYIRAAARLRREPLNGTARYVMSISARKESRRTGLFASVVTHTRPLERAAEAISINAQYAEDVGKMVGM